MKIYYSDIRQSSLTIKDLEDMLPQSMLREAEKYRNQTDYRRSLTAYCILFQYGISAKRRDTRNLDISRNTYGKPYFKDREKPFFSITHSGDYAAVAVGSMESGIDLEKNSTFDFNEVRDLVFTEGEKKFFMTVPRDERTEYFYRFWTLKESYIKFIGLGLSKLMNTFSIELWKKRIEVSENRKLKLLEIPFHSSYTFSACCHNNDIITHFEKIEIRKETCSPFIL